MSTGLEIVRPQAPTELVPVLPPQTDTALRMRARIDLHIAVPPAPQETTASNGPQSQPYDLGEIPIEAAFDLAPPPFEEPTRKGERRYTYATETIEAEAPRSEGETAVIQQLDGLSWEWGRNAPGKADTLRIDIRSSALPVDSRVIESARVVAWLYVHETTTETHRQRMKRCAVGDEGEFAGIVDNIEVNRLADRITLTCRDLTAIPLSREATPALLASLDLNQTIETVVADLLKGFPGGEKWSVEPRGKIQGLERRPNFVLAEEKRVKRRYWKGEEGITFVEGAKDDPLTIEFQNRIEVKEFKAQTADIKILHVDLLPVTYRRVAKIVTITVPPTVDSIFGSQSLTIWDAITRICQKLGIIAETTLAGDGSPCVVLVDGEEFLDGTVFRAFNRNGRNHRIITYGETISEFVESRDLTAGRKVDFVEIAAIDPDTGVTRRERYGRERVEAGAGGGIKIYAHGVTQRAHLKRLAKQAWLQANQGELQLSVGSQVPWTSGGGVNDPDLLGCGAGAMIEIGFKAAQRLRGQASVEDILMRAGVPEKAARILGRASERANPSLLFQAVELTHSYSNEGSGSYRCQFQLQTFLDDGLAPGELEAEDVGGAVAEEVI